MLYVYIQTLPDSYVVSDVLFVVEVGVKEYTAASVRSSALKVVHARYQLSRYHVSSEVAADQSVLEE